MKELYNIDMEADGQFSKLVSDIPNPDIRKLQDKAKTSYTWMKRLEYNVRALIKVLRRQNRRKRPSKSLPVLPGKR